VIESAAGNERGYQGFYRPGPRREPPGWIDGAPTDARGQSCAICGDSEGLWVHPLHADLVGYREYGKGHTLPSFWCICQRCEDLYRAGHDQDLVDIMKASPRWDLDSNDDIEECLRKPLAVFRRADKGGRRMTAGGPPNAL
jgi:hypothetical protein